jgi:hypothetical protein
MFPAEYAEAWRFAAGPGVSEPQQSAMLLRILRETYTTGISKNSRRFMARSFEHIFGIIFEPR